LGAREGYLGQGDREGEAMPQMSGTTATLSQPPSSGCRRSKADPLIYRVREADAQDDEVADTLAELHRLTFFDGAPIPDFDWGYWWLAFHGANPVAFAGAVPSTYVRHAGYVCRVGVLKDHCGHGLQLRLMRAMEARARCNGWTCMVSDTTQNIASANNFIRAGYRLYQPAFPWAFPETLYWRKIISSVRSPHTTHSKRL
jgi:GNAT superfamily N-acetyltransferase